MCIVLTARPPRRGSKPAAPLRVSLRPSRQTPPSSCLEFFPVTLKLVEHLDRDTERRPHLSPDLLRSWVAKASNKLLLHKPAHLQSGGLAFCFLSRFVLPFKDHHVAP